jgi:hypothetical protein
MNSTYSEFKSQTFCILKFEKNYFPKAEDPDLEYEIKDSGTGFFISKNGHFLTAGHVVFDQENFNYYAVNDRNFYLITLLQIQYKALEKQSEPIYHDFALGKVDYIPKKIYKIQYHGEYKNLLIVGYSKTSRRNPINEPILSLDDLFYEEIHVLDEREFDGFSCAFSKEGFRQVHKKEDGGNIGGNFLNGFRFKNSYELFSSPNGMSGSPVINTENEKVVGIFTHGTKQEGTYLTLTEEQVLWINEEISEN